MSSLIVQLKSEARVSAWKRETYVVHKIVVSNDNIQFVIWKDDIFQLVDASLTTHFRTVT